MTGVLPVDKPEGPTSHDVVGAARRLLGIRRIGHTGTLDPFATGLLLLCISTATRLSEYLTGLDKTYEAVARLGVRTDTLDRTGAVIRSTDDWQDLGAAAVGAAFEEQQGVRAQTPPAYSAKKIDGRRAYDLARQGVEVAPEPVEVRIHALEVLGVEGPDVSFRIRCSSGTYVRAVARDAGEVLGVGAHLTALRRTSVGRFDVGEAITLEAMAERSAAAAALIPPIGAVSHLPVVDLSPDEAARVRHGQALDAGGRAAPGRAALAVDGRLLAIAESDGESLRPRKVFA